MDLEWRLSCKDCILLFRPCIDFEISATKKRRAFGDLARYINIFRRYLGRELAPFLRQREAEKGSSKRSLSNIKRIFSGEISLARGVAIKGCPNEI
jgi:hypothetical protein